MIKIVTDTTSGLTLEMAEALDVVLIPQIVMVGGETYRDDRELDTAAFLEKLRNSPDLPKTAAPPPALFEPVFDECQSRGEAVICLHPSQKVSGTVRSASVARQEFPDLDVRVIDTRTVAAPLGTIVRLAAQWAEDGLDADTIVARTEDLSQRSRIFFVVDTLEYLRRGGRIGAASALLGSLLRIKPILCWDNAEVSPLEQARTTRRAMARLRELVLESCPRGDGSYLAVGQIGAEDRAEELASFFKSELGLSDVPIYVLPPAIGVHAGPGTVAVSFVVAPE